MEFGSLGPGLPTQASNTPAVGANPARTATLETNPQNVVTPSTQNDAAENDLRRDSAARDADRATTNNEQLATEESPTSRRTTLSFDSEQNRIFLEIVDTSTEKVVERIPSDRFVALVEDTVPTPPEITSQETSRQAATNEASERAVAPSRVTGSQENDGPEETDSLV